MSLTEFPTPPDLEVDFVNRIGDSRPKTFQQFGAANPHPGFGKDPNIGNEYGHTNYPMWVDSKITGGRVIVNSPMEEAQHTEKAAELKQNGPTIQEYVAKGYKAEDYPPKGYAAVSSKEEVDAFVKAAAAWGAK